MLGFRLLPVRRKVRSSRGYRTHWKEGYEVSVARNP